MNGLTWAVCHCMDLYQESKKINTIKNYFIYYDLLQLLENNSCNTAVIVTLTSPTAGGRCDEMLVLILYMLYSHKQNTSDCKLLVIQTYLSM